MQIDTFKDVQENLETLKKYQLNRYDGNWVMYDTDENGSGGQYEDIELNNSLFECLLSNGYLYHTDYIISHRSAPFFKFTVGVYGHPDIDTPSFDKMCLHLADIVKDKRFTSIEDCFRLISKYYDCRITEQFDFGSYWGGTRYQNALKFTMDDYYHTQVRVPYASCGRGQMLSKNHLFKTFMRYHCRLNNLAWLNWSDIPWKEPKAEGRSRWRSTKFVDDFYKKEFSKLFPISDIRLNEIMLQKKKEAALT